MDDTISTAFQLMQKRWQSKRGPFMDVVQEQHALFLAFQTLHRKGQDLLGCDGVPVAGIKVDAPDRKA